MNSQSLCRAEIGWGVRWDRPLEKHRKLVLLKPSNVTCCTKYSLITCQMIKRQRRECVRVSVRRKSCSVCETWWVILGGHWNPKCPLISVLRCQGVGEGVKAEKEREMDEKDESDERLERRRETGHEHMLPLCAKPHWLRQPTHTLHCCCC